MTTYYLYVKTHNITGLKYLGQTRFNPYEYKGSGTYWKSHIKKHGNDLSTTILLETTDKSKLIEQGLYYSDLWQVDTSEEWANLIKEIGPGRSGPPSEEIRRKISESTKGKNKGKIPWNKGKTDIYSNSTKEAMGKANIGNSYNKGKTRTEEHKQKISEANRGRPAHNKGIPCSEEQKAKLRGKVRSEESRKRIKEAAIRRCGHII